MKKGFGLMATQDIHACDLVIEYVGEVITLEDCKQVKHEPSTPPVWRCCVRSLRRRRRMIADSLSLYPNVVFG